MSKSKDEVERIDWLEAELLTQSTRITLDFQSRALSRKYARLP